MTQCAALHAHKGGHSTFWKHWSEDPTSTDLGSLTHMALRDAVHSIALAGLSLIPVALPSWNQTALTILVWSLGGSPTPWLHWALPWCGFSLVASTCNGFLHELHSSLGASFKIYVEAAMTTVLLGTVHTALKPVRTAPKAAGEHCDGV